MKQKATTIPLEQTALGLRCLDCGSTFLINLELIAADHCPGCGKPLAEQAISSSLSAVTL